MVKSYLLGAGASMGYSDSQPDALCPPSSWNFFLRGRNFDLIDQNTLPDLYSKLQEYIGTDKPIQEVPPTDLQFDIEDFLESLVQDFRSDINNEKGDEAHSALGQCFYFIYELLRHYQKLYGSGYDNYLRLALHYHDEPYSVVSLNYDTLYDTAVQSAGLNTHYGLDNQYPPNSIKLAKIHGSINWRVNFSSIKVSEKGELSEVAGFLFSNEVKGGNLTDFGILPVNATRNIDYRDFIRSGSDFGVPAIIPPFAGHKRYRRFNEYQQIHQFAGNIFQRIEELVIIGCRLRSQDVALFDLLDNNLNDGVKVKVVCRSDTDTVADKISEIVENATIDTSHTDFSSYAQTL
jgi:hypothetical protein